MEPLTMARARELVRAEWARLRALTIDERTGEEEARYQMLQHVGADGVDALAAWLVEAAGGGR